MSGRYALRSTEESSVLWGGEWRTLCGECGDVRVTKTQPRTFTGLCPQCAKLSEHIDQVNVDALLSFRRPAGTTRAERQAAVWKLTEGGYSARAIADRLGITMRTVTRLRARAKNGA